MDARGATRVSPWHEVAAGVFHRRYEPVDVSVVAITGPSGVTVVDTRNNPEEGREILADVEAAFGSPIVAAVVTHAHYDHAFGAQVFVERGIPVYGHARIPAHFARYEGPRLEAVQADETLEPDKRWAEVRLTPPTVLVDDVMRVSPGGRVVELVPVAAGHTDTDLAVSVPDAGVWMLGDVVEQSGPPMFGSGSFPLGWADALRGLLRRIGPSDLIVPGHGTPVSRQFVERQARLFDGVAAMVRASHAAGTDVDAVEPPPELSAVWPDWMLRSALRAGFAQLGAATTTSSSSTSSSSS